MGFIRTMVDEWEEARRWRERYDAGSPQPDSHLTRDLHAAFGGRPSLDAPGGSVVRHPPDADRPDRRVPICTPRHKAIHRGGDYKRGPNGEDLEAIWESGARV